MLDLTGVKNILFDLGGVILNIDYKLTATAFKKIGVVNFDDMYSQAKQNGVFDSVEVGLLTPEEFRNYFKEILPTLTDREIDDAWNAMLLDLPIQRVELLRELKKSYRLFLLSNTNEIHIQAFQNIIATSFNENLFSTIFEKQYYSSHIGLRKPTEACFQFVLDENNLNPDETLFIDDSIQHVQGAMKLGLKTHHLLPDEDITRLFPGKAQ